MKPAEIFVHLCSADDWAQAQASGALRPESLDSVGFVHLSTPQQVHLPANRLYQGRTDLVLLQVNADKVAAPVRWEPGVPGDPEAMLFPHLYGPLPAAAVVGVVAYRPDSDGVFRQVSP
ncbi:glutathione S-transferase [Mycolicibacter minnesotensis]|uniref:Glutathione S-transferase n=1 Tax=Mycolicibacter minnesotensis TaxID=1118379 RepID=A0A7I7R0B4_9MYCO|nr:DUF952 domain-containing protein [Mycolicibacter minnesotensis]ORA98558.1 glutathione S-transferase [Mycolicibacter minnesotensis]BBY32093.1 glutathione S-transferase [Mycolicibacter minnesotensis]